MKQFAPILITGAARSGSSMVAGVLRKCGAFSGRISGTSGENGRGNFENDSIYGELVVPYLKELDVDIFGQYPLPNTKKLPIPADWNKKVMYYLHSEGYVSHKGPWMYKSSKICLLWPIWHYAFPNAKWLIVRRRTGDIINSCLETEYMKAFKTSNARESVHVENEVEGWKWWVHQHERRFVDMITEGINCQIVWPERMVYGDYTQMYQVIEWLGLEWKTEAFNFIDPKLWQARRIRDIRNKPPRSASAQEISL